MKKEELWERQKWTLEQKIDHAVGTVEAFAMRVGWENVYVSFSGGKDSTVLLDIVRRFLRPDVRTVFCNTGNEWPEIVGFVRKTEGVEWIKPKMASDLTGIQEGDKVWDLAFGWGHIRDLFETRMSVVFEIETEWNPVNTYDRSGRPCFNNILSSLAQTLFLTEIHFEIPEMP